MDADSLDRDLALERLSALVDGEVDGDAVAQACGEWRGDASVRMSWHRYQLIGDLLRSEDLASTAARDAAFLAVLRERMAQEPVVLAPQAMPASAQPARRVVNARAGRPWMAVAAGFVAVAGVLVVLRGQESSGVADGGIAAATTTAGSGLRLVSLPGPYAAYSNGFGSQALVSNGSVIRDPRLDRYLAAHKEFAGNSALGVPSMFLHSTAVEVPGR